MCAVCDGIVHGADMSLGGNRGADERHTRVHYRVALDQLAFKTILLVGMESQFHIGCTNCMVLGMCQPSNHHQFKRHQQTPSLAFLVL
jgi:hypothetical protein